ncbi:hypothetical protein ACYH4R_002991 [Listeria monocytogenes]
MKIEYDKLFKWFRKVTLIHSTITICWSIVAWYYGTILYPLLGNMGLKYLEKFHFDDDGKLKGIVHYIPSFLFSIFLLMLIVTAFSIELLRFQKVVGKIGFIGVLLFLIVLFLQGKHIPDSTLGTGFRKGNAGLYFEVYK